jgi:hypothetical protein
MESGSTRNLPQPELRLVKERRSYGSVLALRGSRTKGTPQRACAGTLLERGAAAEKDVLVAPCDGCRWRTGGGCESQS